MEEKLYYPELDGLRFLAFFGVFLSHAPAFTWIPGYVSFSERGWAGVDLFLCLSAFLFVHLLKKEWEKTGTINVWFFYLRRSLRIWPIYIIFVAFAVLMTLQQNPLNNLILLRTYGLLTFTDDFLTAYLGLNTILWVSHLWTISYEEQFYAGIPWFLRFMFKQTKGKQFLILALIFILGLGVRALFIYFHVPHPAVWVLPFTHFESILFGLAIGLGLFDVVFTRVPAWIIALGGIGGLFLSARLPNVVNVGWPLMLLYPLIGLSVSFLVYSTLKAQHGIPVAWLRWKPVAFLGKISYGLYLFHIIAIVESMKWVYQNFAGKSPEKQSLLIFGLSLMTTILISILSYLLIEKPFLRIKSRFTIVQSRPI